MNKYQKRKSAEIKAIMRKDKFGRISYKDARKVWQFEKKFNAFHPCEDCDTGICFKIGKPIVYCAERR